MFLAIAHVISENIADEFNEFIAGLGSEFTKKEQIALLEGMVERRAKFWENQDIDELYGMASKILEVYYKEISKSKNRRKK